MDKTISKVGNTVEVKEVINLDEYKQGLIAKKNFFLGEIERFQSEVASIDDELTQLK